MPMVGAIDEGISKLPFGPANLLARLAQKMMRGILRGSAMTRGILRRSAMLDTRSSMRSLSIHQSS